MGHGIAQVAAMSGLDTRLYDLNEEAVQTGLRRIEANLDKGVARGKVSDELRTATLSQVRGSTDLADAVGGVQMAPAV